jgi:two-component system, NarL family, nitrate/nitrite response regulator NarL
MTRQIRTAIVDDHPMIRDGVALALSGTRDITVEAEGSTSAEAISIAQRLVPDIMLLDINLPGGGFEAATAIARQNLATRIIILTASERDADLATALNLGAAGYLLKGSSGSEIVHAVRTVFKGSSYVTPALASRILTKLSKRTPTVDENGTEELTKREEKIISMVAIGMTNKDVANGLNLSVKTVKHHMTNILQKLQARNRLEAALKFRQMDASFEEPSLPPRLLRIDKVYRTD